MNRRTEPTALVVALALAPLAACGRSSAPDASLDVVRRDSAGIEIVENPGAPDAIPEWTLPPEPILRLGALDGPAELQFYRVADVERLEDGTLVVADGGTSEVRVFHEDGSLRASFGSEGEGPGEFGRMRAVWALPGDSLVVFDARHQRLTLWTLDGELAGTRPLDPHLTNPINVVARFGDGAYLVGEVSWDTGEDAFAWAPMWLHLYGAGGIGLDTIARLRGQYGGTIQSGNMAVIGSGHFYTRTQATTVDERVVTTAVQGFELRELDREGRQVRSIRWRGRDPSVTEEDLDRYRADFEDALPGDGNRERNLEVFDAFPVAERFPAVDRLTEGPAGGVLAREYERPRDPPGERWLVFDAGGRLLGRLTLPDGAALRAAGDDWLIVLERDELDVEYVTVYDLPW